MATDYREAPVYFEFENFTTAVEVQVGASSVYPVDYELLGLFDGEVVAKARASTPGLGFGHCGSLQTLTIEDPPVLMDAIEVLTKTYKREVVVKNEYSVTTLSYKGVLAELLVALTFDDGPQQRKLSENRTIKTLGILADKGILATFFPNKHNLTSAIGKEVHSRYGQHELAVHGISYHGRPKTEHCSFATTVILPGQQQRQPPKRDPAELEALKNEWKEQFVGLLKDAKTLIGTDRPDPTLVRLPGGRLSLERSFKMKKPRVNNQFICPGLIPDYCTLGGIDEAIDDEELTLWLGEGTTGEDSWGKIFKPGNFDAAVEAVSDKMEDAKDAKSTEAIVVLSHDIQKWETNNLERFIDRINEIHDEKYNDVDLKFVRMSDIVERFS